MCYRLNIIPPDRANCKLSANHQTVMAVDISIGDDHPEHKHRKSNNHLDRVSYHRFVYISISNFYLNISMMVQHFVKHTDIWSMLIDWGYLTEMIHLHCCYSLNFHFVMILIDSNYCRLMIDFQLRLMLHL